MIFTGGKKMTSYMDHMTAGMTPQDRPVMPADGRFADRHEGGQETAAVSSSDFGGYHVYSGCNHYAPSVRSTTMNMGDYRSCDSCIHQRRDLKCGMAQQTLQ